MLVIVWWLPTALISFTSFSPYSLYYTNGWFQVPPKHCHLLSLIALMLRVNVSLVFFLIWPSSLTTQCAPDKHSPFLSWCLCSCCLPYTPFFTYYPSFKTQLKYYLLLPLAPGKQHSLGFLIHYFSCYFIFYLVVNIVLVISLLTSILHTSLYCLYISMSGNVFMTEKFVIEIHLLC